ncbi:PAS domain-containing protein [Parvularcula sp. LCG005]|uniref:PAS domain-containing protein n=1 Tax=Parvularcula sp. LCG005 TaxID=3078805 RepID=UPI0029422D0B|nr:PAS domain-containing protein [Parvularcula sp. LCG005]WOI54097.1 PAS domain-containing protein [Parvularcula sp. LCG005]
MHEERMGQNYQQFAETFLRHAPSAIAMFDRDMRYLVVTDQWMADYRLSDHDLIGRSHYEIFPEIPDDWKEMHQRTLSGETLSSEADPFLRADGTLDWVKWRNVPWYAADGQVGGIIMFTEVVSDQMLMRRAIESAVDGIATIGLDGQFQAVNDNCTQMFLTEKSTMLGHALEGCVHTDYRDSYVSLLEQARDEGRAVGELRMVRHDETAFYARVTLVANFTRDGSPTTYYCFLQDISDRRQKEDDLKAKSDLLELTQNYAGIGHWFVDTTDNSLFWSDEVFRLHGVDPAEGAPPLADAINFYHEDDRAVVTEAVERCVSELTSFEFERRIVSRQGRVRWVYSRGECRLDEKGQLVGIFGIFQDITERRRVDIKVREIKEHYELATRSAGVGVWQTYPDTRRTIWSPLIRQLLAPESCEKSDLDGLVRERIDPRDRAMAERILKSVSDTGGKRTATIRMRGENGKLVRVLLRGDVVKRADGSIASIAGSFLDVSEESSRNEVREMVWDILIDPTVPYDQKFKAVLTHCIDHMGMEQAAIILKTGTGHEVLASVSNVSHKTIGAVGGKLLAESLAARRPKGALLGVESLSTDFDTPPAAAYLSVPIYIDAKPQGVVAFLSDSAMPKTLGREDIEFVRVIASWFGFKISRRQQLAHLERSEERFALAAQGSAVGIWDWVDVNGTAEIWSDQFYRLLGYEPHAITASLQTFKSLLHPDDRDATFAAVQNHLRNKVPFRCEYRLRCKSGLYRWFLGTGQAVWDDEGKPRRMIGSIMDVHDQKLAHQLKDEFVSTVSHELRTPLTSIVGAMALARSGRLGAIDPVMNDLLGIAAKNGERLLHLIDDILDIEKISVGGMRFEMGEVEIDRVIATAVESSQSMADSSGVRLHVDMGEEPPQIEADPDRLHQLLTNLLSNAIKFSRPDTDIRISLRAEDEAVSVDIVDQGCGIPTADMERIFERFVQGNSTDARGAEGTGLGLSICRAIARGHQGEITVQSRVGVGSTFTVTLPRRQMLAIGDSVSVQEEPRDTDMPRILHIEDDLDTAELMAAVIGPAIEVVNVSSISQAKHMIMNAEFHIVLLDLVLGEERGEDFIDFLARREKSRTEVIVYSVDAHGIRTLPQFVTGLFLKSAVRPEEVTKELYNIFRRKGYAMPTIRLNDERIAS